MFLSMKKTVGYLIGDKLIKIIRRKNDGTV